MLITRTPGTAEAVSGIYHGLARIQHYNTYGDNQMVVDHLKGLALHTPPGVTIDIEPVVHQVDEYDTRFPLHRTDIDLGVDGLTVYGVGGVHANELAWRGVFMELGSMATVQPDVLRALGIGRITLLEAERVISDRNTWHKQEGSRPIGSYLWNVQRGVELVEYGNPVEYRGYRFVSNAVGSLAGQDIIREIKPDLVVPYHNSAISGPYALLDNAPAGLAPNLSRALETAYAMLTFGVTDLQPTVEIAPGIFAMPHWQDLYDHYAAKRQYDNFFMSVGEDIIGYARRLALASGRAAPVGQMVEAPYYISTSLVETWKSSGMTRREFHREQIGRLASVLDTIDLYVAKITDEVTVYPGMQQKIQEVMARADPKRADLRALREATLDEPDRELNIAELARYSRSEFDVLRAFGQLGLLADTMGSPHRHTLSRQFRDHVHVVHKRLNALPDDPRHLISVNVGATLMTALATSRASG